MRNLILVVILFITACQQSNRNETELDASAHPLSNCTLCEIKRGAKGMYTTKEKRTRLDPNGQEAFSRTAGDHETWGSRGTHPKLEYQVTHPYSPRTKKAHICGALPASPIRASVIRADLLWGRILAPNQPGMQ